MEIEGLKDKIKSSYIIEYIINYIPDKFFYEKLFIYSKKYQKQLNIKLIGLKENYLKQKGFAIDNYLHIKLFQKDFLANEYHNLLKEKNLNKEEIENIIFDIFDNKKIKDIDEEDLHKAQNETLIDIDSPLFNILSKTKNFGNIFTIYISQENIDNFNLKNDYISLFENLNNSNAKYKSIFYSLKDVEKLNYLKDINIDFNKIKKITLKIGEENTDYNDEEEIYENEATVCSNNNNHFFEDLFSSYGLQNNLIYLNICYTNYNINDNIFENINNLKSLKYLYIQKFIFDKELKIKLNVLLILSIKNCQNIKISEISSEKLEILDLSNNEIKEISLLEKINCKNLKKLDLSNNEISNINKLEKANFNQLEELYFSFNKISDIDILEKVNFKNLKILYLNFNEISNINIFKKTNFKKLEILNLHNNKISDIEVLDKVSFEQIKDLNLYNNKISNISALFDGFN